MLKLVVSGSIPFKKMAEELGMSAAEVHAAVKRAAGAGLIDIIDRNHREVKKDALYKFLAGQGLRSFPLKPGALTRGMPTAHAAPPLSEKLRLNDDLPPVWPDKEGRVRGYELLPLYRSVPFAAKRDPRLYEYLALVDAIRGGRTREKKMAVDELRKRLFPQKDVTMSIGSYGITENDIMAWTATYTGSEQVLPDIIRRLVSFLVPREDIVQLRFDAHKAVFGNGYDGLLETRRPNIFSNTATSVWELSVQECEVAKLNKDYRKRSGNSLGIDKSRTTYIALTGRKLSPEIKEKWLQKKRAEGEWADVRLHDAVDIAYWLSQAPAVHHWLCGVMGRSVEGLETADKYFNSWSSRTEPSLTPAVVMAGRTNERMAVENWLKGGPQSFIAVADTREESAVFVCSVILSAQEIFKNDWLPRTLIVTTKTAWDTLQKQIGDMSDSPLIILPVFQDFDGNTYGFRGHYVFWPREHGRCRKSDPRNIDLLPLQRQQLADALREAWSVDDDEKNASKLANDSGGKLAALQRLLGYNPPPPDWINEGYGDIYASLLLIGGWDHDNPVDKASISRLSCRNEQDVDQVRTRLLNVADAPLRTQGRCTKWRSSIDAWHLFDRYISQSMLDRFARICIEVLGVASARYDVPQEERIFSSYDERILVSSALRRGLAESLAYLVTEYSPSSHMRLDRQRFVDDIIQGIFKNSTWKLWATLGEDLIVLAEASPIVFLEAVKSVRRRKSANLKQLFAQDRGNDGFAECCQSGLLWALEVLAWYSGSYSTVVKELAALLDLDDGGSYENRPEKALIGLFEPVIRQCGCTNEQRIIALQQLSKTKPNVAWLVVHAVLQQCAGGAVVQHNCRPQFRLQGLPVVSEQFSPKEIADFLNALREIAGKLIGDNPRYLMALFEDRGADAIIDDVIIIIETHLSELKSFEQADIVRFQNQLRQWVSHQYLRGEINESTQRKRIGKVKELINALNSGDLVKDSVWLFTDHVVLCDPVEWGDDFDKKDERLEELRRGAIKKIMNGENALERIVELSKGVLQPRFVGRTLSFVDASRSFETDIFRRVLGRGECENAMAYSYYYTIAEHLGISWLIAVAEKLLLSDRTKDAVGLLVNHVSTPGIRKWIYEKDAEVQDAYWKQVRMVLPEFSDNVDFTYMVNSLLKLNRWGQTLEMTNWSLRKKIGLPEDYIRILEHPLKDALPEEIENGKQCDSFDRLIAKIFTMLDKNNVDIQRIIPLEVFYMDVLEHTQRPVKYLYQQLADHPEFFVQLICSMYRSSSEQDEEALTQIEKEKVENKIRIGFKLLYGWRGYPGKGLPLDQRDIKLKEWCDVVLLEVQKAEREVIGQQKVGEVLSRVPCAEEDGIWPCRVARVYMELEEYEHISEGMSVARYNNRGVTTRGMTEGGMQERELAMAYQNDADKIRDMYPETAKLLENMARGYLAEAEYFDREDEKYIDP